MKKKIGILRFPGTNCDRDVFKAVQQVGLNPEWLWHLDRFEPSQYGALILPGGFSFGDYLRAGALAARCPVIASLCEAADKGIPILGICNGFQILCETHLLPGTLVKNEGLRFIDDWVHLKLENPNKYFASHYSPGSNLRLPIAHGEGRFYVTEAEHMELCDSGQIWLTYQDNPNGSIGNLAGVMNKQKNVLGLMPHPERAMQAWMGSEDGVNFFKSLEALL